MPFANREEAGHLLARQLAPFWDENPVVLALPRGGVVVASEVARVLDAPLDVLIVRKLASPHDRELGFGAIAEEGVVSLDRDAVQALGLTEDEIASIATAEAAELQRRLRVYREGRPMREVGGRTVIIVDDGAATGSTLFAAVQAIEMQEPMRIIIALPVAPAEVVQQLSRRVERVICLESPDNFVQLSDAYGEFPEVQDSEVIRILERFHQAPAEAAESPHAERARRREEIHHRFEAARRAERDVILELPDVTLRGLLAVPQPASGMVILAAASRGLHRHARHLLIAEQLRKTGVGTLIVDLLSPEEFDRHEERHFDVRHLAQRLLEATDWLLEYGIPQHHHIGFFATGADAAAALVAAAERPSMVSALVLRSGRPDLASSALPKVRAPTLLLVGGDDDVIINLNQSAVNEMTCERQLVLVPHTTHLMEEPDTLEHVAQLASDWFREQFQRMPEQWGGSPMS